MTGESRCPLCGSDRSQPRFQQRGYTLASCDRCELLFIQPYPQNSDRVHARVSDYRRHEMAIADTQRHYDACAQFYKRYLPMIAPECGGARSVLDVGCGSGYLLEQLRVYPSLHRVGIELNRERAAMARRVAACEIVEVPIEEFSTDRRFDVIVMINLVSHVTSLERLFASAKSLLAPNGRLVLKVGEMARDVRRRDMFDWEIPDHLQFLGLNTIEFICEKFGFHLVSRNRVSFSEEFFSPKWWNAPARSGVRNAIKRTVVRIPFALPALAKLYDAAQNRRLYSSFIVLSA